MLLHISPSLRETKRGMHGRNLSENRGRDHGGTLLTRLLPWVCATILVQLGTTFPRFGTTTLSKLGSPSKASSQENFPQTSQLEAILNWGSLFQGDPRLCQTDKELIITCSYFLTTAPGCTLLKSRERAQDESLGCHTARAINGS